MQKFTFHRKDTGLFTEQQVKLSYEQENLLSFIGTTFSKENFAKQLKEKKNTFSKQQREILCGELEKSYATLACSAKTLENLKVMHTENTFTITTGHQLSIFTGPLYLIYKILHVIRLAEELKKEYPENNFVPVFWMASEDHDFEEIKSVEVFSKNFIWESDQKGAVGRFDIAQLAAIKEEILKFFENQPESEVATILKEYDGKNLSEATFRLIHHLFDVYGLLILDGDNAALKRTFIPTFEQELKQQFSFHAVQKTNALLEREGFKLQVNAREINLFYLGEQSRERIVLTAEGYEIEGKGKISEAELVAELHAFPERFSPNVILRPVYQETVLPNLCYVGGVGEISYWLQLKGVFDALALPFPLIQTRTSILWMDAILSKKIAKVSLKLEDLFLDSALIKKNYLQDFAAEEVNFDAINSTAEILKAQVIEKVLEIDQNMENFARAEMVKLEKQLDGMKEKLTKLVKQRHDVSMKTIDQIVDRIFPNNQLQERSMNLFTLCGDGKIKEKIEKIHHFMEPFDPDFMLIRE